jgi:hypothetical protein
MKDNPQKGYISLVRDDDTNDIEKREDSNIYEFDRPKERKSKAYKYVIDRRYPKTTDVRKFVDTKIIDRILSRINRIEGIDETKKTSLIDVIGSTVDFAKSIPDIVADRAVVFGNDNEFNNVCELFDSWLEQIIELYSQYVRANVVKGSVKAKLFFQEPYRHLYSFEEAIIDEQNRTDTGG